MAFTVDERKKRYCALISEKGKKVYEIWEKSRISSRLLVAKAREYVFDKRAKEDFYHKMQALVFAFALEYRINCRYPGFWKKLFHLFAYFRERAALRSLKRALGFSYEDELRDIISVEMPKLAEKISVRFDRENVDGGITAFVDISIDDELSIYLNEVSGEEISQSEDGVSFEIGKEKSLDFETTNYILQNTSIISEERVFSQTETIEVGIEHKESGKNISVSNEKKVELKNEKPAPDIQKTEGQTSEKSVASTIGATEAMVYEAQREEIQPPFPVFKDSNSKETMLSSKSETVVVGKPDQNVAIKDEVLSETIKAKEEDLLRKTPFPVFREEGGSKAAPTTVVEEKQKNENAQSQQREKIVISEENMARRELNVTMSVEQIKVIASQLQEDAKNVMAGAEREWREQIFVEEERRGLAHSQRAAQQSNGNNCAQQSKKNN